MTVPMGFKAMVVLSPASSLTTCLCVVNVRVMSSATPAFSTNMDVHCTTMYSTDLPSKHLSCKQWRWGVVDGELGKQ